MKYTVVYSKQSIKDLKKLDRSIAVFIKSWIEKNLVGCENPRIHGKALKGNLATLWRYRIGDYRLVCDIRDNECIILAVAIGHRREVYRP
ncbi:type II toxin-antitoxin system RelE/ParE family toxin [Succinivibrio sp.]|uniref:type II toxin-antitoxin system RelE family toxin n=1 Tax=Succinivibrio sp. TaxID=2053619 RepID=UPI0025CE2CF1|nr:type II toxin-antitoxin system RelE/ParE family toxin [Succinivibrio sp.]MBQ9222072.1 type II toxin-antitoxin system RelE/ParE family toxin [Succinivibrio sp.]